MSQSLTAIAALIGAAEEVQERLTRIAVQEGVIAEADESGDAMQAGWSRARLEQHRDLLVPELKALADAIGEWRTVRVQ